MEKAPKAPIRVLIADDEIILAQRLSEFLNTKGFESRVVKNGVEALQVTRTWMPEAVIYDLMLPEGNALWYLKQAQNEGRLHDGRFKVLVMSGHNNPMNMLECRRAGASDYIPKPIAHQELLVRLILNLQAKREVSEIANAPEANQNAHYFMHLTDLTLRETLKGAPPQDCLHNLSGMIGYAMGAVRVSCLRCDLDASKGWVVASSDKRDINFLEIDLAKYPEVLYVLTNQKLLALDNIAADLTMHFVRKLTKSITFNSMLVAPIKIRNQQWGVLSIRMPQTKKKLSEFEIRYAGLMANVMGLVIQSAPEILGSLNAAPEGDTSLSDDKPNKIA